MANRKAVAALKLAADQKDFVASNAESLRESDSDRDARARAVVAGDSIVGFLMYDASEKDALIYRLMIDETEQGRGYGRAALQAALSEIRSLRNVRTVSVLYMPENAAARQLYRSAGFMETGLDEDGEMVARLVLKSGGRR